MSQVEVTMKKREEDAEKKHSIVFVEEGDKDYLKTIYIPRSTLKALGNDDGSKPIKFALSVK